MIKQYYELLREFIAFKSISPDKHFLRDLNKTADWLADLFHQYFVDAQIIHWFGNPFVLAKYEVDPALPTCLIYGHYDVQFADFAQWWTHEPFQMFIDDDKIYGRWVADDKGQILIYILTVLDLIKKKKLWYNVVFLLEWEEEIGSPWLEKFLNEYKDILKSDFALISDSVIVGWSPCLDAWYRGLCNVKLKLKTANTDVHSWNYGGVVPNAIHEANKLLSKLFDINNRVTVPYFYYNVEDIHTDILVKNRRMKVDTQKIMMDFGFKTIFKDKDYDHLTQLGLMPTIQITGIQSWHIGTGFKNAIPCTATIHLNFRLVKNQHIDDVIKAFDQWLVSNLPEYVESKITVHSKTAPSKVNMTSAYHKKAEAVLKSLWNKEVYHQYSWGTLPIVNLFSDILWAEVVLVPLANEDCNPHGVDENFDIDLIEKWFDFAHEFLKK